MHDANLMSFVLKHMWRFLFLGNPFDHKSFTQLQKTRLKPSHNFKNTKFRCCSVKCQGQLQLGQLQSSLTCLLCCICLSLHLKLDGHHYDFFCMKILCNRLHFSLPSRLFPVTLKSNTCLRLVWSPTCICQCEHVPLCVLGEKGGYQHDHEGLSVSHGRA